MTQAAQWGHWRPQFRSGEETKRIRAWYRRVACPGCSAAIGRACAAVLPATPPTITVHVGTPPGRPRTRNGGRKG